MKKNSLCPARLQEISAHRQFIYGISALWILFYHMNAKIAAASVYAPLWLVQTTGTCGVEVFLLLTGFGLYYALNKNPNVMRFYCRRMARVLLPAVVVLLICDLAACSQLFGYEINLQFLLSWPWKGRLWYVSFILLVYLAFPLLHRHIKPEYMKRWAAAFAITFIIAFVMEFLPVGISSQVLRVVTRIPVFILGCMLAPAMVRNERIPRWILPASICGSAVGVILWKLSVLAGYMYAFRMLAFIFLGVAVILLLTRAAQLMQKTAFGRKIYAFFLFCGGISLEIYLVFDRVRELLEFVPGITEISAAGLDVISAALTLPIAWLLRKLCEKLAEMFESKLKIR